MFPGPSLVHSIHTDPTNLTYMPSSLPEISKRMHSFMFYSTYREVADDKCRESPSSKYLVGNKRRVLGSFHKDTSKNNNPSISRINFKFLI